MKKKIVAITGYRSDYTKLKSVFDAITRNDNLHLQIVVFGAHTSADCGDTFKQIEADGFEIEQILYTHIQGSNTDSMVRSVGISLLDLSSTLNRLKPDATLIVGDRYEIMAAALSSCINNIPVIHIQGGEISGTIDETLRHSITKLSHIHFPSTEKSAQRIIQMGENPDCVFNVGCPAIDYILNQEYLKPNDMNLLAPYNELNIDFTKDYAIIIQHPVTTQCPRSYVQMKTTLEALQEVGLKSILVYPNPDAGALKMVKAIRSFDAKYGGKSIICEKVKNLSFEIYLNLLKNAKCIIGNSSSGIREAHAFNVPAINIGNRQEGRERTLNIVDVPHNKREIIRAIKRVEKNSIRVENIYGDGTAGQQISTTIESIDFDALPTKRFYDK